jgi:autotransporter passenger strand-loop-strand repeat protein
MQYVVSDGQTSTVTIHGGDFLVINSNGTSVSSVANGGTIIVQPGGLEQNGAVNSGAFEYVSSGGSATGTTVSGGSVVVFGGGVAIGLTASHGAAALTSGAITIQAGATASNTTLTGDINVGGATMNVSGGTTINTIIGNQCVESDGIGSTVSGALVQKGGDLEIGDNVHPSQSAGAFGFNISVGGGVANAYAGTLLSGTVVTNGGELFLEGVGTRAVATVLSNGTEVGGTTTGTIVNNGGFQEVNGNAGDVNVASGTIVNSGGTLDIEGTGTFVGEVVNAGGTVRVGFAATLNGYAVAAQTTLLVTSLGHASGAVVGGTEVVSSSGVTSDTVISGGTLNLLSGAVVSGGISFAGTGGTLDLVGGALPTNTIGGFIPGNVIDIAGLVANGASYSSAGGSGTLTLYDGGTQVGSLSVVTTGNPVAFSLVTDGSGGTDLAVSAATPPSNPSGLALSGGGSSTTQTNPTITGSGTTGDSVTLYEGETALGSATVTGGGWSITTTSALSTGAHNLVATQVDGNHDASSPSSALTITVGAVGPPTVTPHNQSVAYNISVGLGSIFTFGGGAATSYNVYLASPNDGTVTGGNNTVVPGSVTAESAAGFSGMNFVGAGIPGSDQLWLQAVNGAGPSAWVEAVLTEPGVTPDVVSAHPASVAFT